jgi:hypothetical protein
MMMNPVEFYKKLKDYRNNPKMEVSYEQRLFYESFYQEGVKKVEKRNSVFSSEAHSRKGTRLPEEFTIQELHNLIDSKAKDAIEMQFLRKERQ